MVEPTDEILPRLKFIRTKRQEYFVCLSLNAAGEIISRRTVTIGTLNSTFVHPREVFAGPLKDRAAAVIVAHNHPSGISTPSKEDIKTTQQLVAAGLIMGMPVLDHYIIGKEDHFSFRAHHLIECI